MDVGSRFSGKPLHTASTAPLASSTEIFPNWPTIISPDARNAMEYTG